VLLLLGAIGYGAFFRGGFNAVDLGSVFWALFFVQNLSHVVRLSWSRTAEAQATVTNLPAPPLAFPVPVHEAAAGAP
jgi:hypothetical protein